MKKTILSPICSALIIPGLGQVINGNLKKGLILLAMVFVLFLGAVLKLIFLVQAYISRPEITSHQTPGSLKTLQAEYLSSLVYFIVAFALIWIYAVLDAFWTGKKQDKEAQSEDNTP
jgi:uncharacterized BrkB/YihY/UPF0761 family membrane protein